MIFDHENFDESIRPADDFFHYVNGGWIAKNPIPPDESRWGSFNILRFEVEGQVRKILEEITGREDLAAGSDEQKVRDFYRMAMDIGRRNQLGAAPLAEIFKKIDVISSADDLARILGELHRFGFHPLWGAFVGQDEKQSEKMALQFWQAGLNLPDRDYYLNDDEKSRKIRVDYVAYMADMMGLAKTEQDIVVATSTVMKIETRLAKASLTRVALRDVEKMYNKIGIAELAALAPAVPFMRYFEAVGLRSPEPEYVIVGQPDFIREANRIIADTPLDDLKIYLRWHVLNGASNCLSEELERRNFEFYGRTFSGEKEMKPLWRRALRATDAAMDELLGKLYVAKYFSEDAKQKVKDLVEHLVAAYRARIEKLDWMGLETKQKAFEKLAGISRKLGYPDVWKDYSALAIETDSFAENVLRAHAFEFDRKIKEVGGPVNRAEWLMSPQTVNAYYMPPMNDIVFPAAILQPPFFDPAAEDAVNFGGIGTVIGHELTHGFDDQGSRYDAKGNLNEWWTPEDKTRFDAKAEYLTDQFDSYEPLPGLHVNGKLTLGENIADLGGLLVAYDALKLKLAENSGKAGVIDGGLTPEQKFFMNYALTERGSIREENLRLLLQVDPHSPSQFRVNGPLSNMPEFYEAFGVGPGDKLWRAPEDRVQIW